MSSVDSSRDALTIQQIIASIPAFIDLVSAAKSSIPLPPQLNTNNTITTTTLEASAVTTVSTTSNVNDNNVGSNTTTSISTPGKSNKTAAATAPSTSTSGPAPSLASASALDSGLGSTSTTKTTEGCSNGNTTTSKNANIKDEISDGRCCMLGYPSNNPSDKNKKKDKNITVDVGNDGDENSEGESNKKLQNQLEKLTRDLYYVQSACEKLKHLELHVGNQFKSLQKQGVFLQSVLRNLERVRNGTTSNNAILAKKMQLNIKLISEMVMELKHHIPSPYKLNLTSEVLESPKC
ncbi:hypothetical protein OIU79_020560 [Salix purpurea]|uniref:Uncharacterized protein n=1 Tax=Salix purpurea TaxID=77065 RepID=A0A9Q1AG06_SALPP|nr:hypothetical protein OIU79_020560 [Salix purpurea]